MHRALRIAAVTIAYLVATEPFSLAWPQEASAENPAVKELFDEGLASFHKNEYRQAIRAFSKAFELSDNRSTTALHGIGTAYLRMSKFDKAQTYGEQLLELGQSAVDQAAAENLIGAALLGKAQNRKDEGERSELLAEAETHLRASLELSSGQMSPVWLNLSVVLQEQDRLSEALDAQKEYVDRTPESQTARARLNELKYLVACSDQNPAKGMTSQVEQPVAEGQVQVSDISVPAQSELQGNPVHSPRRVDGELVLPPVILRAPTPQYNQLAREARIQGVVIIEAIIDKKGNVTNVKVVKGLPLGLDKAAADAVKKWKFKPATLNCEPVAVIYNTTVSFRLE